MNTYILVDSDGTVVNYIVWDGKEPWQPPEGLTAIPYNGPVAPGHKWNGITVVDQSSSNESKST
jgi:hypothetical protein